VSYPATPGIAVFALICGAGEAFVSKSWPQVIRDPVHDIILFEDTDCDRLLLDLINTREFQRLRRVKQLGLCDMVFPGANHSRFAHCIGVMQTARKFLDRIQRLLGRKLTDHHRLLVSAAALLHDVGHGPFSHAFEKVTGESHERRTLEIIRDDSTEIHRRLRHALQALRSRRGEGGHPNLRGKHLGRVEGTEHAGQSN
jgi:HD superfamily phosphohydrolase